MALPRESARGPERRFSGDGAGLAPDDPSFDISSAEDIAALFSAETSHFWHLSRNRILERRLRALGVEPGAEILELGCGAGCVTAHLSRLGYRMTGVEGHDALLTVAKGRAPRAEFYRCDLRYQRPPVPLASFRAVGLFDVIEHLDDPVSVLELALDFVRPGGWLVGTVPAMMSLWSGIDEHSGHRTRYSRKSLSAVLGRLSRGEVAEVRPFNRVLVPMLFAQRKVVGRRASARESAENLKVPWRPLNAALFRLVMLEDRVAKVLDRAGLEGPSIWFAVRKPVRSDG